MLLTISTAHRKIDHLIIIDLMEPPLLGRASSALGPSGNSHGTFEIQFRKKTLKDEYC
jgi:hypothetical protein